MCCHVLPVLLKNFKSFISDLKPSLKNASEIAMKKQVKNIINVQLWWDQISRYMEGGDLEAVYDIIWTVKFFIETLGLHQGHNLVVSRVLEQTKNQTNKENSVKVQLIVLDLINVLVTKLDRTTLSLSLDTICSQETFKLLLDIIATSDGETETEMEQKLSAIETLSGLVVSA